MDSISATSVVRVSTVAVLAHSWLVEVFDAFRHILQEGEIEKRTQYVIEQLFAVRRTHFQEYPRLAPELDLVEDGDQITHRVGLDDKIDKEEYLDVFHVEEKFEENEETWKKIKSAILGESESEEEDSGEESEEEEQEEESEEGEDLEKSKIWKRLSEIDVLIEDQTDQDKTNLNRTVRMPSLPKN